MLPKPFKGGGDVLSIFPKNMGLDMYLEKHTYVGNNYRKTEEQVQVKLPEKEEDATFPLKGKKIKQERITTIVERVGYWRKANAIHRWFVDNVQNGEDDCKDHYVEAEGLKKLLEKCNQVLDSCKLVDALIKNGSKIENGEKVPILQKGLALSNPEIAHEVLPTQDGFFFGGTDYDQYYYEDIQLTKKIIEEVLAEGSGDYYYRSSW